MEETVLLTVMATYTLLAALCSILFNRLRLPALIGYLVAGIIVTNVFDVTEDWHSVVEILSDIGLVMLMFSIGMEIDISKVLTQGKFAIKIALIQLPLLVLGGMVLGPALGFGFVQSIALGAIISGSSTAVVLAVLKTKDILTSEQVELLILITIMEDIGQVIILSMITPLLAGSTMDTNALVLMIVSILAFMIISLIIGLKFVPRIINWVSDNVAKEVLVIFAIGLAFGMAILSVQVGLSMAIGAFLMGMMISPCKSCEGINHSIEPMKDLFMAMFFISVGMEIHVSVILDNIPLILIIYLIFAVLKWSTVSLGYWICDADSRIGFMSAISLIAMGEFAFIIAKEAFDYGVFTDSMYTSVIGAALVSMVMLPLLTGSANKIWAAGTNHMPAPVKKFGSILTNTRNDIFDGFESSSKMTKKAFNKGMGHAYFNIMVIAVIEVAFYWLFDMAAAWLCDVFGGELLWWEIGLVVLNLFVLLPPTARFIANAKVVSGLILNSCSQISRIRGHDRSSGFFNSLYRLNTFVVTLAIDFLIVLVVPNPLGLVEHLICLAVTVLFMFIAYKKARRDAKAPLPELFCPVEDVDEADDSVSCPLTDEEEDEEQASVSADVAEDTTEKDE